MILIGDTHLKDSPESLYNRGLFKFFDWVYEQYPDETILFSGDVFDSPNTSWSVYSKTVTVLRKFKKVYAVCGNHDLSPFQSKRKRGGTGLEPLGNLANVTVIIDESKDIEIEGMHWRFMPYVRGKEKKDQYQQITDSCDFALIHMSPPGFNYGNDEILLGFQCRCSYWGHIHINHTGVVEGIPTRILGVPQTTRNLEQNWKHHITILGADGKGRLREVPEFFNIKTIDYAEHPENLNPDFLYNIVNAPNYELVREKFSSITYRRKGVQLARTAMEKDEDINVMESLNEKLVDKYIQFCKDNEIDMEVRDCGVKTLQECEVAV